MKLKLTQPGWEGYTGQFGAHEFKDGISVEDLGSGEVRLLSAIMAVEEVVDGESTGRNPSVAQEIIDKRTLRAEVVPSMSAPEAPAAAAAPAKVYSEQELADIADAKGIKGVREIGAPLGINGKSIAELIGKILGKQAEDAAKAKQAEHDAAVAAAKAAANATAQ